MVNDLLEKNISGVVYLFFEFKRLGHIRNIM